jgi:hypothetical protein
LDATSDAIVAKPAGIPRTFFPPHKYAGESYGWPLALIETEPLNLLDRFKYQWLT